MPSSHLILGRPLLLLPPTPPSIRVFSNESTLRMRWPKYWSFSFSISPSKGHPGLISFRMDWLDLLAVQGTLKSLLQHHHPISYTISAYWITSVCFWHRANELTMGLELELVIIMKHLMKIMEMHYCVVVQSTFFNLSLNLAIRSSWSEPRSAPGLVCVDCTELLHFWLQRISSIWFWCWSCGYVHV